MKGKQNAGLHYVGADWIAIERFRQIADKRRTVEDDMRYPPGTLAMAAICYALFSASSAEMRRALRPAVPFSGHWPWPEDAWKPGSGDSLDDRIRELEKAGALIAAQIDVLHACKVSGDEREFIETRP